MKTILALVLAAGAVGTATAPRPASRSASTSPGVYGRINIGDVPRPALYHAAAGDRRAAARRR